MTIFVSTTICGRSGLCPEVTTDIGLSSSQQALQPNMHVLIANPWRNAFYVAPSVALTAGWFELSGSLLIVALHATTSARESVPRESHKASANWRVAQHTRRRELV